MRSMCCGSSVSVKDTTEFLSFPSSRTCLYRRTSFQHNNKSMPNKPNNSRKFSMTRKELSPIPQAEHSPYTEQSIMCSTRQEIEAAAVRRSCGGKAQGRHSGGVACEFLYRGKKKKRKINKSSGIALAFQDCVLKYICKETEVVTLTWSQESTNLNGNQLIKQRTHPVNFLGVQVPHLDYLSSWKQQLAIMAHTQTGHCSTVCLPLTLSTQRDNVVVGTRVYRLWCRFIFWLHF